MKVGDLIKFNGSWGSTIIPGERQTGIVMDVWTNGRTGRKVCADVLWDNGDFSKQFGIGSVEVINADR